MTQAFSVKILTGIIAALAILAGLLFMVSRDYVAPQDYLGTLSVVPLEHKGKLLQLFVVDTPEKQARGLSYIQELPVDTGMLFIFPQEGDLSFWMKDMYFPIDIVWLDQSFTIIDIRENIDPETYPETFSPAMPAQYVIEVPAGKAGEWLFNVGDTLELGL
ncbi:MAG: DUF192 domain-containing protein [Candidatus Pacebacteria bacterium]|nr:DUF192 domain-containing protein [Candidatus Paceibacterota bacterium]